MEIKENGTIDLNISGKFCKVLQLDKVTENLELIAHFALRSMNGEGKGVP